ncbi:MAG TPA: hypothetical protein VGV09_14320 [Steroidobacteraceae bacterium]|nr:hypothetical protein [Steroidobacteraceae bacterium]
MTRGDVASWIMDILVNELGLKSGDTVPLQQLKGNYRARNGDAADIKHGLQCALELEWLDFAATAPDYRLTALGFESAP